MASMSAVPTRIDFFKSQQWLPLRPKRRPLFLVACIRKNCIYGRLETIKTLTGLFDYWRIYPASSKRLAIHWRRSSGSVSQILLASLLWSLPVSHCRQLNSERSGLQSCPSPKHGSWVKTHSAAALTSSRSVEWSKMREMSVSITVFTRESGTETVMNLRAWIDNWSSQEDLLRERAYPHINYIFLISCQLWFWNRRSITRAHSCLFKNISIRIGAIAQ